MFRHLPLLSLAVFVTAACPEPGTPSSGGGSFTGSVGGNTVAVRGADFRVSTTAILAQLSDRTDMCEVVSAGKIPKDYTGLNFNFGKKDSSAPAPGVYSVVTGQTPQADYPVSFVYVDFFKIANCTPTTTASAISGTVTITKLDGSNLEADYDVSFPGTETAKGNMKAVSCSAVQVSEPKCE